MAKKLKVSKTQAVHDYLKVHPGTMSGEIAAALAKQGIKITPSYVANIKTKINKGAATKRAVKKEAAIVAAAPAAVVTPKKNGDTITLEQVKKVAHTIQTLGGFQRVTEVLAVIKELGGVKRFKDLAEAMTATETMSVADTDAMPF